MPEAPVCVICGVRGGYKAGIPIAAQLPWHCVDCRRFEYLADRLVDALEGLFRRLEKS